MKATSQNSSNTFDFPFDLHFICLILKTSPNRFFSTLRLSKKGIIFPFHTQDVKIDSLHDDKKFYYLKLQCLMFFGIFRSALQFLV